MNQFIDKIVLFICCTALYLVQFNPSFAVIPIIIVVILSSLFSYSDRINIKLYGIILFVGICIYVPSYIIFLPVLLYDLFYEWYQWMGFAVIFLFVFNRSHYDIIHIIFILGFLAMSYMLKMKTSQVHQLQSSYHELRDNTTSFSQLLEEKNRTILSNQDYEINLATLNERNRISKEIHDNIGHMLSRSILMVGALLTITEEGDTKDGLSALKDTLSQGMNDIRNSIHDIYDESVDLYSQIDKLVKEFTFCKMNLTYDMITSPSIGVKHSLIAITKEAMANIIRHSNGTKADIILREHPGMYQLIIQDNGVIDEKKQEKIMKLMKYQCSDDGMGLRNISDRVKGLDGNINVILTNGFKLFITIPKGKDNHM